MAGTDTTMAAQPRPQSARPSDAAAMGKSASPPRQRQPPHDASELRFAQRTLRRLVHDSRFFPARDDDNRVRTINESELDVGALVGRGGFCEVRRASLRRGRPGTGQRQQRHYAMKYLSPAKTGATRVFQRGIADLAMEACFLSLLQHEHIIGLHYVAEGSLEECYDCAAGTDAAGIERDEVAIDANGQLRLRRRTPPRPPAGREHFYGYFLLLDPLHETLTDRMERTYVPQAWLDADRNDTTASSSPSHNLWDRIRHKNDRTSDPSCDPRFRLAQRLHVLNGVASALRYLHEDCRLVFRDVKPDNIGFYRRYRPSCTCGYIHRQQQQQYPNNSAQPAITTSTIPHECTCYEEVTKLFDFGLAKELKQKYRKAHPSYPDLETYKLTSCTGSRRYMAPEVCFADPYNQKADVYSFGVLLYQAASLVTPFDGYSLGRHEREVLRGGRRPDVTIPASPSGFLGKKGPASLDRELPATGGIGTKKEDAAATNELLALRTKRHWPKELPRLMEECWDGDMRRRPDMLQVCHTLGRCIESLLGGRGAAGAAALRGGDTSWNGAAMGGMAGDAAAAAHRWPRDAFFRSGTTTSTDAVTLAAKAEHELSAVTMETSPTSSSSFLHSSGFLEGVRLPFESSPQHQYAFARSQHQQRHAAQHPMLNYSYPQSLPAAVPDMATQPRAMRDGGYEADTSDANFDDSAVCRQQKRRSTDSMRDSDPSTMMQ